MGGAVRSRLFLGTLLVTVATPLYANNPPGPQVALAELAILPAMIVMTAIGGGYAVLRQLPRQQRGWMIAAVILIVFSWAHEGYATLVALLFAIIAIVRATRMLGWGVGAMHAGQRPAHLATVTPARMISAACLLLLTTIFLGGMAAAFVNFWPHSDEARLAALRKYVALQLALATPPSPQRAALEARREDIESKLVSEMNEWGLEKDRVSVDVHRGGFVVTLLPNVRRFPFFPYNYLVAVPSYRADQAGTLRMIHAHGRDTRCPPEAPIIDRIDSSEVKQALAGSLDSGDR